MKYFISSLVGAVIGYVTNWLAIKMLFWPHREYRIGKFKIPFTPGLIPKEKSRIAKSVGETIGQHLLTKETIIQSLCSEDMNRQLDMWVQNKLYEIESSHETVGDVAKALLGDEYNNFIDNGRDIISELLAVYINEEKVRNYIVKFIGEQITSCLSFNPKDFCESQSYNSVKGKLIKGIIDYKDSEAFVGEIKKVLGEKALEIKGVDKRLEEIIPREIKDSLKEYVFRKRFQIAMGIKEFLKREQSREKIRKVIEKTVGTKLNPMIALFINTDRIYEKVVIGLYEFLNDEKNHEDIAGAINDIIDEIMKISIGDIVSELPEEGIDSGLQFIVDMFRTKILDEKLIEDIFYKIESKFTGYGSFEEILEKTGIDYKRVMEELLDRYLEAIAGKEEFKTRLSEAIKIIMDKVLLLEIKHIFQAGGKIYIPVTKIVRDLYNKFIENNAGDVIEVLNVSKIVEDKINEFDVDYAEKIILEVSSKELKAITWLGALLGAILGVLSPVLGSLY